MDTNARDFDFLIGSWTVEHERLRERLVGSSEQDSFSGTSVCRRILDGMGNTDEIVMPALGMVGVTLRLFNPATQLWSIYWASSLTGTLEPPVVGGFDDDVGLFYSDETFDGQPIRVRFTWDRITETGARWQQAFSPDQGESWETNWTMTFTRLD